MNITEIIKDAFVFPSKNLKMLLIYIILSLLAGIFGIGGIVVYLIGFISAEAFLWGGLAVILSMIIGWLLSGYQISVIKSGIDQSDDVPQFVWWDNFITGFNNFIVSIVYFIIPTVIVVIAGYLTNIYGNFMAVVSEIISQLQGLILGTSSTFAFSALSQAMANLVVSIAITAVVAVVLFVIFTFLQTMAQARLANTGSLSEALNIFEAAKDISRIGVGKVIAVIILVIIIVCIIQMVLSAIFNVVPILSFISIIVTPYLIFFTQRSIGLLYSDIA